MKLIIGLGNPGKQYANTRHNAGFLALDFLRAHFEWETFHHETRFHAECAIGIFQGQKYILIKPTTFMNHSGTTVRALLNFYHLTPSDILVIHDDLDIAPGTMKITASSRAAGHNGVQNIIDMLGTQDFRRIRLGIGHPENMSVTTSATRACQSTHEYVLATFPDSELALLQKLFQRLPELISQ